MKKPVVPVHFADLSDVSFEEATARIALALSQAEAALAGLQVLTAGDRGGIDTIFRDGEREAVLAVIAAAEAAPAAVAPLREAFSPDRLRAQIERRAALLSLADRADRVALRFADSARVTTRAVKSAVSDAYELLKPVAQYDAEVASRLAPAVDFYAAIVRRPKAAADATKADAPVTEPVG
jgi:hypothetical protein